MSDEATVRTPVSVRLNIVYPPMPFPVENTGFVKFSHIGGQVMMDLGVIDDQSLILVINEKRGKVDPPVVDAHVLHRFAMSVETFQMLRRNLDEIVAKMRESLALLDDGPEAGVK